MKVKVTVIKDDGSEIEFSRPIGILDNSNIINSIEQEITKLQSAVNPFISETLLTEHQAGFVGEKNQEEKWDA